MNIGQKVRIRESMAGKDFSFSDGEIVEITNHNKDFLEGLLRGGSAEAETFQVETIPDKGSNEDISVLSDDIKRPKSKPRKSNPKSDGGGVSGLDADAGQPVRVHTGGSDEKHPVELREDAPSSPESEIR